MSSHGSPSGAPPGSQGLPGPWHLLKGLEDARSMVAGLRAALLDPPCQSRTDVRCAESPPNLSRVGVQPSESSSKLDNVNPNRQLDFDGQLLATFGPKATKMDAKFDSKAENCCQIDNKAEVRKPVQKIQRNE